MAQLQVDEIVALTEYVMQFYHSRPNKENAADETYQLLERTLRTTRWYKEDRFTLHALIAITTQYAPEYRLCCEYYEYILYCMEKEEREKAEEQQGRFQIVHG